MFAGTGGSGVKDMPSEHSKIMQKKCIVCHFYKVSNEDDIEKQKGGHTFKVDERVCLKCHKDANALMQEWKGKIDPLLKQLNDMLDKYPNKTSKAYIAAKRNFAFVIADGGTGIHNPKYAYELLRSSISLLRAEESESIWKK